MAAGRALRIAGRAIGPGRPVFVIAEAGVNHNGDLRLAKRLVDVACAAGADAVKFQSFRAEELATRDAPKARYQERTAPGESQFAMLKRLELTEPMHRTLIAYCRKKGILFLSTPFDPPSATLLHKHRVPAYKVPSGELTNLPLLRQIARYGRPIILSTGMSTLEEVAAAARTVYGEGNRQLVLLHCTSNYPARMEDCNLNAIRTLRRRFGVPVGYSDHTLGSTAAVAAVALGACVVEKHFTLDTALPGPDHKASADPDGLRRYVAAIRETEKSLGDGRKVPAAAELEVKRMARKSVVARADLDKGTVLTEDVLALKRPATGIPPGDLPKLLGRRLSRAVRRDTLISWSMLA